jgi:ABC-type polysaccharide/polyol phosphate export permease/predicted Zn-dependent protease
VSKDLELAARTASLSVERAIEAGELGAAQARLTDATLGVSPRAALYCRLGEAFFYRGRREDALACARTAFDLEPGGEAVADFCAWLFSNCERHAEAATAYERLLDRRPGWAAGHRHLSGSYAAAGDLDRAIQHAARACELDPNSPEFAVHAGLLLASVRLHRDAIDYFARAERIAPGDPMVLHAMAEAALTQGERAAAVDLSLRAHALAPGDRGYAHHATEMLLRARRFAEAAEIITAFLARDADDATGHRLLSAALMQCGRTEAALSAIERALALVPDEADYHLHRGNLLYRLARFEDAVAAFDRAAVLEPQNPVAKRSQLTVYFDSGRFRDALAVGGELISAAPDNEEYAQAVLAVLHRRFETLDGDFVVLGERTATPPRTPCRPCGFWEGLTAQSRVVHALIIRETRTRFGDSALGYGWALLEPVLHISLLSLVFSVVMHGQPPIGNHFFIFYYTGIIPYHIFVHTSSSMTYAVSANSALLQLPLVGTFDVILARALLELSTDILIAVILLAGFATIGLPALPHDFGGLAAAVAATWLFACGCGFINAVVNAFFKAWDKIWTQLTRMLYFGSGIFYVPGMMPDWVRERLAWNPILQGVDWFRSSFFADYTPHWLDRVYLVGAALFVLTAGLTLERGLRRGLYEPP